MALDKKQLELNFNLHSLQPNFSNLELHYIIAKSENDFRFAEWSDIAGENEQKFYCFLVDKELFIPAGNITLKQSYLLEEEPIYPTAATTEDFVKTIEGLEKFGSAKCVRKFSSEAVDSIQKELCEKYGQVDCHVVKSDEGQHYLMKVKGVDISISATMVYFRDASQFIVSTNASDS
jgi:hypothetical protein